MIGANGVMNRVAEDGVLVDWFRKPHRRFGTTYRIINLITHSADRHVVLSGGDMSAWRGLCVRCRLELLPESPGRAGSALSAARSGIQIPPESGELAE